MRVTYVYSSIGETERETIIFFPGRILTGEYLRSLVVERKCEWKSFQGFVCGFFLSFFFFPFGL